MNPYTHTKPHRGATYDSDHEQVQGLVGWWRMAAGRGGKLYDEYGNHGVMNNFANPATPTSGWSAGQFGSALAFDGTNNAVIIPDSDSLSITGDLTIALWVNPDVLAGGVERYALVVKRIDDSNREYELRIDPDFKVHYLDDGVNRSFNSVVLVNEWTHVAMTRKGTALAFYINGRPDGTSTADGAIGNTASDVGIGARPDLLQHFFDGLLDDVRIHNIALTPAEVERIAFGGYPMFDRRVYFDVAAAPTGSPSPRAGVLGPLYGSLAGPVG